MSSAAAAAFLAEEAAALAPEETVDSRFSRLIDDSDFDLDLLISRERANYLKQQVSEAGYLNSEDDTLLQTLEATLSDSDAAASYLNVRPTEPEEEGGSRRHKLHVGNDSYIDMDGRPVAHAGGYLCFDAPSEAGEPNNYLKLSAGSYRDRPVGDDSGAYLDVGALMRTFKNVALGDDSSDGAYCDVKPAAPIPASGEDYLTEAQVDALEKMLWQLMADRGSSGPVPAAELDSLAFKFTRRLDRISTNVSELSIDELIELAGPEAFKAWVHKEATLFKASGRHNHGAGQLLGLIRDKMVRAVLEQQRLRGMALRVSPKDAKKLRYLDQHVLAALEQYYCANYCGNKILKRSSFLLLSDRVAVIESSGKPDFDKFDDICNKLFIHIGHATAELLKGLRLSPRATFYISGKIVKGLEKALYALGAAGDIELCPDGIRKVHLEGMGTVIWKLGRLFGMRTVKDDMALLDRTAELIAALNRLVFLLDRVLHDRPPLVDMNALHSSYSISAKVLSA